MGQTSLCPFCNTSLWFFVCVSVSESNVLWGGCPKDRAVTHLYGSFFVCFFQRVMLCGADIPRTMLWHSLMRGAELSPSFTPGLGTQKLPIRFDTDICPHVQCDGKMVPSIIPGLETQTHNPFPSFIPGPETEPPASSMSFFSRVNLLCCLLFQYPFHPHVTTVACERSWSFCQKCRWQVTAKHANTLRVWLCMK